MQQSLKFHGITKVILTTAHMDHDKTNNRFWNLKHLCQKCHLHHDRNQHDMNRKYGREWKKWQIGLFWEQLYLVFTLTQV
jgi:heterodisulfide reductase subunit B